MNKKAASGVVVSTLLVILGLVSVVLLAVYLNTTFKTSTESAEIKTALLQSQFIVVPGSVNLVRDVNGEVLGLEFEVKRVGNLPSEPLGFVAVVEDTNGRRFSYNSLDPTQGGTISGVSPSEETTLMPFASVKVEIEKQAFELVGVDIEKIRVIYLYPAKRSEITNEIVTTDAPLETYTPEFLEAESESSQNGQQLASLVLENNYTILNITNSSLVRLRYKNRQNVENEFASVRPLSLIVLQSGAVLESNNITPIGQDSYNLSYENSNIVTQLRIVPQRAWYYFELLNVYNPDNEEIKRIDIFNFNLQHAPQSYAEKNWAYSANDNELFMAALSMSPSTTCGVIKDCAVYNNQYCERNSVRCFASPLIGLGNVKGALLTAPKQEYLTAQQEMISVHAELPRTILSDDKWLRLSDVPKESYLFAKHTPATHAELLHLAQLGKFPQFLAKSALLRGSQTQPRYFTNLNEMKAKLNDFISNGTKVGIHTHLGVIDQQDNLINWANPSQPLNELIESFYIGKLDSLTVNSGNARIVLQNGQNSNLTHFLSDGRGEYYLIGNELFKCANVNDPTLEDCRRGMYGTSPSSHDQGESVYIVPLNYLGLPFLKHGSSAFNQSVDGFAQTLSLLNAKMAYIDGTDSYVTMPGFARKSNEDNTMKAKLGLVPYLRKIEELSSQVPLYQTGGITSTFGWWYDNRIATDDGAVYKSKEYTKAKVKTIENSADKFAHYMYRELGWWRFAGSYITNGKFDFDATTADDLHYLMTKAIAFDTSVGMQLDPSYTNHAKLDELFSLIGFYHEFLNKTRSGQITIPSQITDYLQNENAEAELVYVPQLGGYQLINKSVQRIYASWSSSSPAHYTIQNPFGAQNASFVIKARFDYYPYNDPQHLTITDHFDNWFELTNSSSSVSCEWQDNNGHLRISNNGGKPVGCKIQIPLSGRIDLTNKRGLAIKITGDNSGAVGMVRIQKDGFAMRDYKFKIDFSGTRELVLGDAAGENEDYNERGERIDWEGYIAKKRHWSLDFSKINEVYVFINNVQPSQEVNIQLHELKALAEKNNGENKIVNPRITINSRQITFNVNLSTSGADAYMLAYDGNSNSFSLYSANLENLGTFLLDPAQRLELTHGQNDFEISSDLSSPDYSARAEVIFTTDDDEDNDGVPTNGDYLASNNLCNPSTRPALVNFCDDNDNTHYNPSQT